MSIMEGREDIFSIASSIQKDQEESIMKRLLLLLFCCGFSVRKVNKFG